MRLVTFQKDNKRLAGGYADDGAIIDLDAAAAEFGLKAPGDMLAILSEQDGLNGVRAILDAAAGRNGAWRLAPDAVKLLAPIPRPPKVLGVALNYRDFCERGNLPLPDALKVFNKVGTTIIGPGDRISLPAGHKVTYEGELGVVIGRRGKGISPEDAFDFVAGYTVVNDLTANDAAKADVQLMRGKNFDTFCPLGPVLVTKDEVADPYRLTIRTTVNGAVRQEAKVNQMIFKIPEIIRFFSSFLTLEPGDVIATGTPAGTALQHNPPAFLLPGDVVVVAVEGIGTLTNTCQQD